MILGTQAKHSAAPSSACIGRQRCCWKRLCMDGVFLAGLGAVAARVGGAGVVVGAWRVTFWGALALGITWVLAHFSASRSEKATQASVQQDQVATGLGPFHVVQRERRAVLAHRSPDHFDLGPVIFSIRHGPSRMARSRPFPAELRTGTVMLVRWLLMTQDRAHSDIATAKRSRMFMQRPLCATAHRLGGCWLLR